MTSFISYSQYKRQYVLNETYESYVELKQLAKDIFDAYEKGDILINKMYYIQSFTKRNYNVINNLLNANIGISIYNENEWRKGSTRGVFNPPSEYDDSETKRYGINHPNGYIIIYKMSLHTLIHELQHAYDHLVSKGKFSHTKIGYKERKFFDRPVKLTYTSDEERDKQFKEYDELYRKLYFRSPHELSANFIGTLNDINFFIDEKEMVLRNFREVYDEFIEKFKGYHHLTPKDKKILARKFSQYYYKLKERKIDALP